MQALKLNTTLVKLTALLSDGQYHDGVTMGKALNMTRSAIWKLINKLKNYGIAIDAIKGKGYILRAPLILLNAQTIQNNLANQSIDVDVFERIDSTHTY